MNQFLSAIYFLPCIICLIWTFIYSFRVKTTTQKMMLVLLVLSVFYFIAYAFYISPLTDYKVMAILDIINIPVILVILAVDLIFIWTHQDRRLYDSRRQMLLYTPVLIVSSLNFLINYLLGIDNIACFAEAFDRCAGFPDGFDDPLYSLYYQFNAYLLSIVLIGFFIAIFYSCIRLSWRHGYRLGDGLRFFFRANVSNPIRVVCFLNVATLCLLIPLVPLSGMGRSFVYNHPIFGCTLTLLLSVTLFCLCYVEYMIDIPQFSLSSLSHVNIGNTDVAADRNDVTDEEPADRGEVIAQPAVLNDEQSRVGTELRRLFDEQCVYLEPELNLMDLASRLNTNRTTLSLVIGQCYGVNFRQLVARYRIDKAKRFMLENPEAKQDEVALSCGFTTAQAFNQKFKELVGEAPRMWMVKQSKG